MDETNKNDKKTLKPYQFQEGNPGGPGRPPGSKNYLTQLEEAIEQYETESGKKLFERLIQRAFVSDMVLLNVIKKFLPDKTHTEIEGVEPIQIIVKHVDKKEDQ